MRFSAIALLLAASAGMLSASAVQICDNVSSISSLLVHDTVVSMSLTSTAFTAADSTAVSAATSPVSLSSGAFCLSLHPNAGTSGVYSVSYTGASGKTYTEYLTVPVTTSTLTLGMARLPGALLIPSAGVAAMLPFQQPSPTGAIQPATASVLGGIKVGSGLSVQPDGTLSATGSGSGTVSGPSSSVNSNLACWNGTTGTILKDCGIASANLALLNGSQTFSGTITFSGTGNAFGTPSSLVLTNATGLPSTSVIGLGTAATVNTGTSGATVPLLNGTNIFSGPLTNSLSPAASQSALLLSGTWDISGTSTTNLPQAYISCANGTTSAVTTWASATGLGLNACSGFSGYFVDAHINGGASLFSVSWSGSVHDTNTISSGYTQSGQYQGTGTPSIAAGSGAGTSPGTISASGTNNFHVVTVTTGSSPSASATIATITFSPSLPAAPVACWVSPRNAQAAAISASVYIGTATASSYTLSSGASALTGGGTVYIWAVECN